ncbi:hydroxymethylbilane synthase [Flavihumibacter petaseus]|uniref:Hydroxymethylbilane synthase n=1 Tax=Flavihumibacter petaseus NBRC 106054 TaxID=1220578 RepID=A0A0E9MXD2_9BACT|nr:hydroxymethylbilane synthase [Flavihumibacter petaseus]GAO41785.1 porphobilinogen deaminase [Flavihumibacter petaseus NBRC 106054]
MNQEIIRIGTRDSQLALWQAHQVEQALKALGHAVELVLIKSEGDLDLTTPLYEMGVQGIFTKTLDAALLAGRIDVAVHSMKDVPTKLATGLQQAAVLERGNHRDVLITPKGAAFLDDHMGKAVIATSSIRRRAQWLHRYPHHELTNLRGNVNTRMKKVFSEPWDGAIFAAAGLERTGLLPADAVTLDWMLPAPAQGAVVAVCRENDAVTATALAPLNHALTALCAGIERDFLRTLMGGCSTPISAYAQPWEEGIHIQGNICSPDGSDSRFINLTVASMAAAANLGQQAAERLLAEGGNTLMDKIRAHG